MHGGTQIHTHSTAGDSIIPAQSPPTRQPASHRSAARSHVAATAGRPPGTQRQAPTPAQRRAIQQPARPRSVTDDPSPTSNPSRILNHTRAAHAGACFLSRPVWPARTQTRRRPPMRQPRLGGAPLHRLLLGVVVGCYRIVRHLDGGGGGTDATRRRHQQ